MKLLQTLHFPHPQWQITGILLLGALLLLVGWFYTFKSPKNTWRKVLQLILHSLAVVSLVLLGLQPQTSYYTPTHEIVLLTSAPHPDTLTNVLKNLPDNTPIYAFNDTRIRLKNKTIKTIPNLAALSTDKNIARIQLLGNGLPQKDLHLLHNFKVEAHLNPPPQGISALNWQRHLQVGDELVVQGTYRNTNINNPNETIKLRLNGAAGLIDSITIKQKGLVPFTLKTKIKQAGKWVFQVEDLSNKTDKAIPFTAYQTDKDKILIISSQPVFELKFLKNWLAKQNYGVTIQNTISKDKHKTEFLNMPSSDINALNQSLFRQYQLLIITQSSLYRLSSAEQAALAKTMRQNGMSVLVLLTDEFLLSPPKDNALIKQFSYERNSSSTKKISPQWQGGSLSIAIEPSKFVINTKRFGVQSFIDTPSGKSLAAYKYQGLGKLGVSLVRKSQLWVLTGNKTAYSDFWQHSLQSLLTNYAPSNNWRMEPTLPYVHQPVKVQWLGNADKNNVEINWLNLNNKTEITLPLAANPKQAAYESRFWPTATGWHQLSCSEEKQPYTFYVFDEKNWECINSSKRISQTQRYLNANNHTNQATINKQHTTSKNYKNLPLMWFYLAFLTSIALLWIENKI